MSGAIDYSTTDPRLALGIAGTRMTVSAFKRLWPAMVTPRLRSWVVDRVTGGTVERIVDRHQCAALDLRAGRPAGSRRRAVDRHRHAAAIRSASSTVCRRCATRTASCACRAAPRRCASPSAMVDLPSGRKLTLANGMFEVPDTHPKPSPARTRFRAEGSADAAAELLALERLRDSSQRGARSGDHQGQFRRAGRARLHLLTGALTKDNLNYADRRRHHEFRGREMGARPEGRSRGAEARGEHARASSPAAT